MTDRVAALLEFHACKTFGNRANLLLQNRQARMTYLALTREEQQKLTREAIAEMGKSNDRFQSALCCLACFCPGSLIPFHRTLLEQGILYPGLMFHGASDVIASKLIGLCEQDDYRDHALNALAWIGDEVVQRAFAEWRRNPPPWVGQLHIPPHRYATEAGWELTEPGNRRDLFSPVARPLIRRQENTGIDGGVKIGVPAGEACEWCSQPMVTLLEYAAIEHVVPSQGVGYVRVVTCHVCTCFGPIFIKSGTDGKATWHQRNEKPAYLPTPSGDSEAFPETPLVMSNETRSPMEAANWGMLPGVTFSQVGGLPTWIQDAAYPECPDCSQKMPFIGQISNEDFIEYGEGIYYAFRCPACKVTGTCYQQT